MRNADGRRTAKRAPYTRKPNKIRHSASNEGATPALKAVFAMMPPTPKHDAAVNANAYPRAKRSGGDSDASGAEPTEGPRARGVPVPTRDGVSRVERVSVGSAPLDDVLSPLPSRADRGSHGRPCGGSLWR